MIVFRKARSARQTLNDLDAYINSLGKEPVEWLAREVQSWGEFSYRELETAILDGHLNDLIDWQARYADVVNNNLAPMWAAAAKKATKGQVVLDDSDVFVKAWIKAHGGELITQLSEESRRAVAAIILRGQAERILPRDMAKQIRPLIGLTEAQTQANINYREKVYRTYAEGGAASSVAAARADKAALRYAGKQHRARAETIVHTELAFAYNRGAHMGVSQAISDRLMGRCEMVWSTAGTNRVCGRCLALKDTVVGHTDESGVTLPPLHPRCRCAIMYREIEKPKPRPTAKPSSAPVSPLVPASAAVATEIISPPSKPTNQPQENLLNSIPEGVGLCRTFDESRLYWAENYNVKVAVGIAELNFEAVRAAMSGVETILKEFPQAGFFLKELNVLSNGLMSTWRGHGRIYFNPEIFSSAEKATAEIAAGVASRLYPKNMTAVGAGAHEAAHIVEDWLIRKFKSVHTEYRPVPRRLIREAYQNAILTPEGKGKSLKRLIEEIASYTTENPSECLATAVSDYITNGENSSVISRKIWARLKEELTKMLLPDEVKMAKFSIEERDKYGVFDEDGFMISVKDNAPAEFKEAYEWDKKRAEERWAKGMD